MSYQENKFTEIADAIREKKGTSDPIQANNFADEILTIPTGGGGLEWLMTDDTLPVGSKAILTQDGDGILKITVPEGVTKIGNGSFSGLYIPIKKIILPNSLINIGNDAMKIRMLEEIELPQGLYQIGSWVFSSASLSEITIPEFVISVGNGAFAYNKLKHVEWNSTLASIPANCFVYNSILEPKNTNEIETFIIPSENVVALSNTNAFSSKITSANPMTVYVPASLITSYQTATNWSSLYSAGRVIFEDIANRP